MDIFGDPFEGTNGWKENIEEEHLNARAVRKACFFVKKQ
jgi:hypothetical protein